MKPHLCKSLLWLALVVVVTHQVYAENGELDMGFKVSEHNLGKACKENITCADDKWGLDLTIDLYQPFTSQCHQQPPGDLCARRQDHDGHFRNSHNEPFLILACGGDADKSQYSRYAGSLARLGYNVAVMNKVLFMTPPPPAPSQDKIMRNVVTAIDFHRVIEYAQTNVALGINATSVVLLGHSYGGAMALSTARGFCYSFFCGDGLPNMTSTQPNYPVELSSAVIGGFVYGLSIYQFGFPGNPMDRELTNLNQDTQTALPFFFMWGEYDVIVNNQRDEQYIYRTTWENQNETKAYAIGENLDHDSIANEPFSGRNVMNSTLPRLIQIRRIAVVTDSWVQYLMNGEHLESSAFCLQLGIPLLRNDQHRMECDLHE